MMKGAFFDQRVFDYFHGGDGGSYCKFPQCGSCRRWRAYSASWWKPSTVGTVAVELLAESGILCGVWTHVANG